MKAIRLSLFFLSIPLFPANAEEAVPGLTDFGWDGGSTRFISQQPLPAEMGWERRDPHKLETASKQREMRVTVLCQLVGSIGTSCQQGALHARAGNLAAAETAYSAALMSFELLDKMSFDEARTAPLRIKRAEVLEDYARTLQRSNRAELSASALREARLIRESLGFRQ